MYGGLIELPDEFWAARITTTHKGCEQSEAELVSSMHARDASDSLRELLPWTESAGGLSLDNDSVSL